MSKDAAALVPAAIVLLLGVYLQSLVFLNHDVAWVLDSSARLLNGGTFGTEIVAANPPLIWWISAIFHHLADTIGVAPVVFLKTAVACLILAALAYLNIERGPYLSPKRRALLLVLVAFILAIGVHRDFGQREQLSVIFCIPWVMIAIRRAMGEPINIVSAFCIGIIAGIAIAFKPHFVVLPILVTAYQLIRLRSFRVVFSPENIAIVTTCVAYLGAALIFAKPYFTDVLPLITQTYWGFENSLRTMVTVNWEVFGICAATVAIVALRGFRPQEAVPAMVASGFMLAALAQAKGYSYHFYPVIFFSLFALAFVALSEGPALTKALGMFTLALAMISVTLTSRDFLQNRSVNGAYGQLTACLIALTQDNVSEDGGFMAISTHPYPGFPITNYSDRRWVAATNSRLFLPSIVRLRALSTRNADQSTTLKVAETAEHDAMLNDITHAPELVLVDERPKRHAIAWAQMDFVAFYQEDPKFAEIWSNYEKIDDCGGGISAFKLIKENG